MIQVNNMSFSYSRNRANIFDGLGLTLEGGRIYGLLGKNGAGKTTLLKLIAGLRFPNQGSCKVLDMEARQRKAEMLREIYFLTEETWLPETDIKGYLRLYADFYPRFDRELFERCLREFEISPNDKLKSMSFGQRKKSAIAFALATRCRILIMDEPTNGLDIPSKGQFRKLVSEAVTDDRCIILSTHQVRDLESLIDTIIILENRRILLNQTTEEICSELSFKTVFTLDQTEGILHSEFTPKGFQVVTRNTEGVESKLDLEALFNFATQQPELVQNLFNH